MPAPKKKKSLDEMAKAKGFPSYAAFAAWNEKYRKPVTKTASSAKPSGFRNFLQTITDTIPIQFASRRVVGTLQKANKK